MPCFARLPRLVKTALGGTALAALLGGCSTFGIDQDFEGVVDGLKDLTSLSSLGQACDEELSGRLVRVPWQFAEVVPVRIRQGEFSPMVITLQQDEPYVLRITNRDDENHTFRAREFFRNVAVASAPGLGPDLAKLQGQTDSFGMALEPNQDVTAPESDETEFERMMGGRPAPQKPDRPEAPETMGPDPFAQAMQGAIEDSSEAEKPEDMAEGTPGAQTDLRPVTATEMMGMEGESACALEISSVKIPARETVEVRLVAAREGSYRFENSFLTVPSFYIGGAAGVVVIEQPL
ncbi:MAG: hypothetical protein ACPGOV_00765 [Magnetovibrionaceae bacterium]